ncbi:MULTISPECIES: hypothetical protein [Vibrio]|uniref:DUF2509 family protein n=1 Tax=Vibrio ostreae TaxID=2841925 RepID=A0A975U9A6_9VIBR|nr:MULTISPECIES: hypothetical protein [Vibrio]QXO16721.1 hypothetical protein KNV97_14695 [Vibrio ostreae]WGY46272.1 hypothetical protein J0X00_15735 [Vibrio sp. ABG19]
MSTNAKGMVTLLVVSLLLMLALVMTLGLHQALFYQIKRAHNELISRQQFWIAEGGLECLFSITHQSGRLPDKASIALCNQHGLVRFDYQMVQPSESGQPGLVTVGASYGYRRIQRTLAYVVEADTASSEEAESEPEQQQSIVWQPGSWSAR